MAGPTQNYERSEESRWTARPKLALFVRFVIWVIPIAVVFVALSWLGNRFPAERLGIHWSLWFAGSFVIGGAVLWLMERVTRKFLPVVALLNMSMVFPDKAPDRFKVALRSGTVRQLEERISRHRDEGSDSASTQSAETLLLLARKVTEHDRLTRGHSERVRAYSDLIAEEMGLPERERDRLRWAALLHDVGKLAVPAEILNKKGKPTSVEWKVIAEHPKASADYLAPIMQWLGGWHSAATQHHERYDGAGYPLGLKGEDIHLGGRIVAVADAFDTMTSTRSYKKAMSAEAARALSLIHI